MNLSRFRALPFVAVLLPVDIAVALGIAAAEILRILIPVKDPKIEMRPADLTKVTIQILNWDGKALLHEFLPTVIAATRGHRVLIVDNGSTDGSVELVKKEFRRADVVELDRNHGFSRGNNLGAKHVETDILVFLNNDMAVDAGFLEPLLRPFSDPSVFAVASSIVVPDPAKAHHETGRTCGRFERGNLYFWHDAITSGELQPVLWAGGGACAVDRRKFELLGGFDELYQPFYVEDADLCYQAWKRGWKSLLAPASRVVHKHRGTSSRKFGDAYVDNTTRRNLFLFVWKNVTDPAMLGAHVLALPRTHARAMRERGAGFELRAYLRAVLRLPLALWGRIRMGAVRLRDDEVLQVWR